MRDGVGYPWRAEVRGVEDGRTGARPRDIVRFTAVSHARLDGKNPASAAVLPRGLRVACGASGAAPCPVVLSRGATGCIDPRAMDPSDSPPPDAPALAADAPPSKPARIPPPSGWKVTAVLLGLLVLLAVCCVACTGLFMAYLDLRAGR